MRPALTVLLHPYARATHIRLVIDPFVYLPPVLFQASGGTCKDHSGLSLEFSLDRLQ